MEKIRQALDGRVLSSRIVKEYIRFVQSVYMRVYVWVFVFLQQ